MPSTQEPSLQPEAVQAWSGLESRVAGVQHRHHAKFLSTGLCMALTIVLGAFLGFSAADILFKFSVGMRLTVALGTLAGVALAIGWYVIRPWRRLGGAQKVAANVEQEFPQLENQLSTALEYGRNPDLAQQTSSPALVSALIRQAAEKSSNYDFGRTVRWKSVLLAAIFAFVFAAGVAAYGAANPRLFKTTLQRFIAPTADVAPPTLTVITQVLPGNSEFPVETSVPVEVQVDGRAPETATLSVFIPDPGLAAPAVKPGEQPEVPGRWEDRPMDRGPDGVYRASLRRLLDSTRYKIRAGDDESKEFRIDVYKIPEISEFVLRLEYPAYTGKQTETLAPGVGDVRALKGTVVHLELKANTDLSGGQIAFKSGASIAALAVDPQDRRKASGSFKIDADDEYQVHISNAKGVGAGSQYMIKALKDRAPKVMITKPEKDLAVHREQTITVEISAEDDVGVREMGIIHSLGLDETKTMVRKLDPPSLRADGKLVWELGNLGLKGGEVIAYYAYALDNDTVAGPKMAKSEIHFLTIYDEEEYDSIQTPQSKKNQKTPESVKQLDKLIDLQKKLLKETFAQARANQAAEKPNPEGEKAAAQKTLEAQKQLKAQVQELLDNVKKEIEKKGEGEDAQPRGEGDGQEGPTPPTPPGPGPQPDAGMGEKEVKHMERAIEKMGGAEEQLKVPDAANAVTPETEALRSLSETRRLLLSQKDGSPRFKMAMNNQAKKKKNQDQNQQQQDQQDAKQEMAELPKMLEREKETERDIEQLQDRKKNNPPPPAGQQMTDAQKKEQEEQRRLERELQKNLDEMAKEAEKRARTLERLSQRNPEMQPAAEKMQQAADKTQQAAMQAKTPNEKNLQDAQQKLSSAENSTRQAQRELRNAMDKQVRQELANLQKDAQDLADRQQDLADQMKQMNAEQQGQKPQQGDQPQSTQSQQPKEGQQPQQSAQGQQPKEGQQPNSGQQASSQPQSGKQPQAGSQNGESQPKSGEQGQQASSSEQRMKGMAGQQREINNDLRELADRMEQVAGKAREKGLAGAGDVDKARQQAREDAAAAQSGQKSQQAMAGKNAEDAEREAQKAAKAMEQVARTLKDATQKTSAGDMKAAAAAMKKLQQLQQQQSEVAKGLQDKQAPSQLAGKEEQVATGARDLADQVENMEVLRQSGREASTKEKLEDAARQALSASEALKGKDANAAKDPAAAAEKSLNLAMAEMERATGKTMEEKAREAKNLAKAARENQEKAAEKIKDVPAPKAGEKLDDAAAKNRDDAAGKQAQAARDAKRLEQALEGLKELAQEANPAAAEAAREGKDLLDEKNAPKAMDDLAKGMEQIGDPKKKAEDSSVPTPTPDQAARQGEEHAQTVRQVEKQLDNYIAEAVGAQLDKLRNMEQAAREAAKKASDLAEKAGDKSDKPSDPGKNDPQNAQNSPSQQPGQPGQKGEGESNQQTAEKNDPKKSDDPKKDPDSKQQSQKGDKPGDKPDDAPMSAEIQRLEKELERLQTRLEKLEPNAPEKLKMREALTALQQAREQSQQASKDPKSPNSKGDRNLGGPAMKRASKSLDEVAGGIVTRIERLLQQRDVRADQDEDAPKEYRSLVDKYYRALSDDMDE